MKIIIHLFLMPIYEFFSPNTRKVYSFYAKTSSLSHITPFCPDGKAFVMKKIISGFSITGVTEDTQANLTDETSITDSDPFADMSASQASAVMKEIEAVCGGMDGDNPDPRQMGAVMRRISEMTGEKIHGGMEEVIRKLEEGADPEDLEDRMGEFDDLGEETIGSEKDDKEGLTVSKRNKTFVVKDPNLYEMENYIID